MATWSQFAVHIWPTINAQEVGWSYISRYSTNDTQSSLVSYAYMLISRMSQLLLPDFVLFWRHEKVISAPSEKYVLFAVWFPENIVVYIHQ